MYTVPRLYTSVLVICILLCCNYSNANIARSIWLRNRRSSHPHTTHNTPPVSYRLPYALLLLCGFSLNNMHAICAPGKHVMHRALSKYLQSYDRSLKQPQTVSYMLSILRAKCKIIRLNKWCFINECIFNVKKMSRLLKMY